MIWTPSVEAIVISSFCHHQYKREDVPNRMAGILQTCTVVL